jgi:hypothetical protein
MNKTDIIAASPEDKIKLIRLNVKCLSMLDEADQILDRHKAKTSKYIKFKVKRPFLEYISFVDKFNAVFMKPIGEVAEQTVTELMAMMNEASGKIDLVYEEKTELVLVYCKARSILYDLNTMKYTDKTLDHFKALSILFISSVEESLKNVISIKDPKGYGVEDIVSVFNRLGDNILYKL